MVITTKTITTISDPHPYREVNERMSADCAIIVIYKKCRAVSVAMTANRNNTKGIRCL